MAWVGFTVGLCLLALVWSSVVKTLLIVGNTRSLITRMAARAVLAGFRLGASHITSLPRRERVLSAGPPVFLVGLLGCWIACLYAAYALTWTCRPPSGQERGHASAPSRRCHSGRSTASPAWGRTWS